ncbi:hypothetical protein os1_32580 [Comamonadaceae bacterium OS-1]|nr:hypothetical protein os1_32580 [Comamonadaceae bacterium OS-1]
MALTAIEHRLLQALHQGASNKRIALDAGKSEQTVRNQLHALFRKIGVSNRTQAANWLRDQYWHMADIVFVPRVSALPLGQVFTSVPAEGGMNHACHSADSLQKHTFFLPYFIAIKKPLPLTEYVNDAIKNKVVK